MIAVVVIHYFEDDHSCGSVYCASAQHVVSTCHMILTENPMLNGTIEYRTLNIHMIHGVSLSYSGSYSPVVDGWGE